MGKIKEISEQVKFLLEMDKGLRDNDNKLISMIWNRHLGQERVGRMTANGLLAKLWSGELPDPGSITRARRKIQELHPHLLGEKRKKKRAEQEEEVKQELRSWKVTD